MSDELLTLKRSTVESVVKRYALKLKIGFIQSCGSLGHYRT